MCIRDRKNHKAQELWKEKVWRGYAELKKAGFKGGDSLFLIAAYFAGKPDKTITPLLRRLQMVMKEREDLISGGMLAASYYGMEMCIRDSFKSRAGVRIIFN